MAHDAVRDDVHFQSPKNGTGELAYHWHEAEISCRTHGHPLPQQGDGTGFTVTTGWIFAKCHISGLGTP